MRILVTGVSGLLGLNLAFELSGALGSPARHAVTGVLNTHPLYPPQGQALPFTTRQMDLLCNGALERLLDEVRPDWVIHCAALANLEACEADPELARRLNTELPRRLAGREGGPGGFASAAPACCTSQQMACSTDSGAPTRKKTRLPPWACTRRPSWERSTPCWKPIHRRSWRG